MEEHITYADDIISIWLTSPKDTPTRCSDVMFNKFWLERHCQPVRPRHLRHIDSFDLFMFWTT